MSEDITPRQPDDNETARLLTLILSRLDSMDARLDSMDARLDSIEGRLAVVEDRIAPTNQLPKIYTEVAATREDVRDLKDEFAGFRLESRADIRDLKRSYLKIEEWIDHTEAQKN